MNAVSVYNQFWKVDEKFIQALVVLGLSSEMESEMEVVLKYAQDINYSQVWTSTIPSLDNEQLVNVFKGLVIAEKHFQWRTGSAAAGILLYREIQNRKLDSELYLGNWSFLYTNNPYIPFGLAGNKRRQSKDAFDFVQNSQMQDLLYLTPETRDIIASYA
jgi:hypothetical protein